MRWLKKEENLFNKLIKEGKDFRFISKKLNRSMSSVRQKAPLLGVRDNLPQKVIATPEKLNKLESSLASYLRKNKPSIMDLADKYDVSPKTIRNSIYNLKEKGYNLNISDEQIQLVKEGVKQEPLKINVKDFFGSYPKKIYQVTNKSKKLIHVPTTEFKFGAIADTHLGSKYERLDLLNLLYDIFKQENVKAVFHGGNYVDGEFRFNKYETKTHGFDEMIDYFIKNYPEREGITTYFVDGDDHEGWWTQQTGLETGRVIEERAKQVGRNDLKYVGYQEADFILQAQKGRSLLKLMHGGGGTAYADSYSTQKLAESFQEGEKPHILLVGHYHKNVYHTPRGIHTVQVGCLQDQTRFMRKKKLRACLGGYLIKINQAPTGEINRFKPEWIQGWSSQFYKSKITSK